MSPRRMARRAGVALALLGAAWGLAASGAVEVLVQRLSLGLAPGPADRVTRLEAGELVCPAGASAQRRTATTDAPAALWCERRVGDRVLRDGPYLELAADGSTARQGTYARDRQVGTWVRWDADGRAAEIVALRRGESNRHLPRPEDLCPPGSVRRRSFGYDDRRRMWSECVAAGVAGEHGAPLAEGPTVTWDEERGPDGATRYVLREVTTYRRGELHGPHLVFAGAFGREAVVERETFDHGVLAGESRGFYLDGALRELRRYRDGALDGERIGYGPDGSERWRVTYDAGRVVSSQGDLAVARTPCPPETVPTWDPDGRSASCARRSQQFVEREGPYAVWDEDGRVLEAGRYEAGVKTQLAIAPPGVELPPAVSQDTLVAAFELFVGEEAYRPDRTPRGEDRSEPVHVWFRAHRDASYPQALTAVRDHLVEVYGLSPGTYYGEVDVDANAANDRNWPGDLVGTLDFRLAEGEVTRRRVQLLYTLHLVAPRDNGADIPGWSDPCHDPAAVVAGPIRFAWERPPLDPRVVVSYRYRLTRRACDGNREIERADGETSVPALALDLPPSRPGEIYEWGVSAWAGDLPVGQLMTFAGGGYGWSLRFRVP